MIDLQGLPTDWVGGDEEGTYSTGGVLPTVSESTRLHVGWFNETLPAFLKTKDAGGMARTPVAFLHMDADLYSCVFLPKMMNFLCSN